MFSFFKKKPPADSAAPAPAPVEAPAEPPAPARSLLSPSSWFGAKPAEPTPPRLPLPPPRRQPLAVVSPPPPPTCRRRCRRRPPPPAPVEAPPPERSGWLGKLKTGLRKTGNSITAVFVNAQIDDALYEELEEALLMADTGVKATEYLLDDLRRRVRSNMATDGRAGARCCWPTPSPTCCGRWRRRW